MEEITKGQGDEIVVTKTIPEQVVESKYTKKQLRGEIDVCNEKIDRLQIQINDVEQRFDQEKGAIVSILNQVRDEKAKWKALLDEAVKLIPE